MKRALVAVVLAIGFIATSVFAQTPAAQTKEEKAKPKMEKKTEAKEKKEAKEMKKTGAKEKKEPKKMKKEEHKEKKLNPKRNKKINFSKIMQGVIPLAFF